MMKEFTPPVLCLLGPASNGLDLFYYSQKCDYMCLQWSNNLETCCINSRMPKNAYVTSFCLEFCQKIIKLWLPLVTPLFVPHFPQNLATSYKSTCNPSNLVPILLKIRRNFHCANFPKKLGELFGAPICPIMLRNHILNHIRYG